MFGDSISLMMLTRIKQAGNRFNIKPAVLLLAMVFLYISTLAQLKADFTASVTSGCTPLFVKFKDASTGNPTDWLWNLGNGGVSVGADSASAIYITPGTY